MFILLERTKDSTQILSSRKTRIKTPQRFRVAKKGFPLRYYPPEKQGLRPGRVAPFDGKLFSSDTILQKNKD